MSNDKRFPRWHPYFRLVGAVQRDPGTWRSARNCSSSVFALTMCGTSSSAICTHHAWRLHHFPKSKILVSEHELATRRLFAGRLLGWACAEPMASGSSCVDFEPKALGPFGSVTVSLQTARRRRRPCADTPGHVFRW